MGKIKISRFNIDSYYFKVYVEIAENSKEVSKRYEVLKKKYKLTEENSPCLGFTIQQGLHAHIVLSEYDLCYDLISHECSHLTFRILNSNGIVEGNDNEQFALLNGYINSKVFKIILNKECKIQTIYPKILPANQL